MKITTKLRYGLRAIIYIAKKFQEKPVKRKEITLDEKIPDSFLKNILTDLARSGLIISFTGSKGGFSLSKPPEKITLFEVIESLEGKLRLIPCIEFPHICDRTETCPTQTVWEKLEQVNRDFFKSYTLQSIIDMDTNKKSEDED